ncbi:uncharacterized protein EV422DRAFT_341780 [Fimicolochytrium jonesii]|uniref:uncharacterized protein n=1 Tax=Fimicolochytrium jonesii TaxID=1396493 RepID=UPI0022FE41B8|nr:uncharacterized protein EV422DRAFT_341780 [Fimicolochytrium jonesii]KAI8815823.1 hypothetical protein EV422DRAFT_341780 [Fimicolochytrium jonesii]
MTKPCATNVMSDAGRTSKAKRTREGGWLAYKRSASPPFPPLIQHLQSNTTFKPNLQTQPPKQNSIMPLRVRVVSIAGVKDKDDLGGNDLYVRVSADGSNWEQTSVKKGAGKQAVFDEAFTFPNYTPGGTIYVEVYDKDVGTDDKLGTAKVRTTLDTPITLARN